MRPKLCIKLVMDLLMMQYILLKEVLDNSIDEYVMGDKTIRGSIQGRKYFKDYKYGIPLGKVVDVVKMNTGGKYDLGHLRNQLD